MMSQNVKTWSHLKSGMTHFDACHSVLLQLFGPSIDEVVWEKVHVVFFLIQLNVAGLAVKGEPEHIVVAHEFGNRFFSIQDHYIRLIF